MIRILLAASVALLTTLPPSLAQPGGQAAADEVRVIGIIANGTLSVQERSAITQADESVARADPKDASTYASALAKLMAKVDRAPPQRIAAYRTIARRNTALGGCAVGLDALCAVEAPIIQAHDPAILVDRTRQLVFTRASIAALVAGAQAISGRLDVPPPGKDAAELIAQELRTRDAQGKTAAFDVMENAVSNDFNLGEWNRAAQSGAVTKIHDIVSAQRNEADRVFFLAQAAALVGKRAGEVGSSGGGGPGGLMAGAMRSQAMGMMSRAFSSRCMGVGTGANFGYCSGN